MALVGKAKDRYTLYVGGGWLGNRLAYIYKDLVPDSQVVDEMVGVFAAYKANRQEGESIGDFCSRVGKDDLQEWQVMQSVHEHCRFERDGAMGGNITE